MDAVQRWLTLLTLVAAALAALGYLVRQTWQAAKWLQAIHDVVEHELSPNSGSSMKDDMAAMAVALGGLQRDVADLTESKETAHDVLQVQLDTLADALGVEFRAPTPTHRRDPP